MKQYEKVINGIRHTFQLSDEDAKAQGLTDKDVVEGKVELAESPLQFDTPTTDGQDTEAKRAAAAKAAAAPKNKAAAADDSK